jgi:hypothetical protein
MEKFYHFYLSQHENKICRRLHFAGTLSAIICLCIIIVTKQWSFLIMPFVFGYLPAWVGHFFFEHNKPATFKHPIKSLYCDFLMFYDIARGKISW